MSDALAVGAGLISEAWRYGLQTDLPFWLVGWFVVVNLLHVAGRWLHRGSR